MGKKILKLISVFLMCLIMVGCAGMGDYEIDLINGFKISRINGETIVITSDYYTFEAISIPEDKNPKKPEYITQVGYDEKYIVARTNLDTYYILNSIDIKSYGPLTKDEFDKQKNKLNIKSSAKLKDLNEYEQDHGLPEKIYLIEIFGVFPFLWLFVLPLSFIFNSIILVIILKIMNLKERKNIYQLSRDRIFFLTWLSQLIAILIMRIPYLFVDEFDHLNKTINFIMKKSLEIGTNPFDKIYSFIFLLMLILMIGIMNYLLVYRFSLKKVYENEYIDQKQRKKIALLLAILNIPYFVYIPIGF